MLTHLRRTPLKLAKVPRGTPTRKSWHVERQHVVGTVLEAYSREGGARLVGLVGRSGAGKTTAASEIVRSVQVREAFPDGIVWLSVNEFAKDRLSSLLLQLARMVYDDIAHRVGNPPLASDNGAAYIKMGGGRGGGRLKCLVVADNVWEAEVVSKLLETGMWVLLSTRDKRLITGANGDVVGVDELSDSDAQSVLRKAAELPAEARLSDDAIDLIDLCGHVAMDLAFVGRWSMVRGRQDRTAWSEAAERIEHEMGKIARGSGANGVDDYGIKRRRAIIQAGFDDLGFASDDERVQRLYLSLGVLPDGHAFTRKDAAMLLYDKTPSADDEASAGGVLDTLERWAVLRSEEGLYRMHDTHSGFARESLEDRGDVRKRALKGWLKCIASLEALRSMDRYVLKRLWIAAKYAGGEDWAETRPYVKALNEMTESHPLLRETIEAVATFQEAQEDWEAASAMWHRLLDAEKRDLGEHHPYVLNTYRSISNCSRRLGNAEEAAQWLEQVHTTLPLALAKVHEQLDAGRVKGLDGAAGLLSLASTMTILSPGDGDEAEMILRRSLHMQETELGPQDVRLCYTLYARTLHKLGVGVRQARRLGEAEELLKRCLAVVDAKLGPEDAQAAVTLHELGNVVRETGRLDEAEGLWRRCLAIQEAKLGRDDGHVAVTLSRLASCIREAGRLKEAEVLLRRSLAITEANQGPDDMGVASILCELGGCVQTTGRLEEAEELLRRCLAIQEVKVGPNDVSVASTLFWLGACVRRAQRLDEAEKLLKRCLAIVEAKLGPEHAQAAVALHELGIVAGKAGRLVEAERLLRRCLAIQEAKLGHGDAQIAATLSRLAAFIRQAGRVNESGVLLRRCLVITEANLGPEDMRVASVLRELGGCVQTAGRFDEAEKLFRRCLAIQEAKLGPENVMVASTLCALGTCVRQAGRMEEAEHLTRRSLAIEEAELGPEDAQVAYTLHQLGLWAHDEGRLDEAEQLLRRCLAIRDAELSPDDEDVASALFWLGVCLRDAGRWDEAKDLLSRCVALEDAKLGPNRPSTGGMLYRLGSWSVEAGQLEEGEDLLRRSLALDEANAGPESRGLAATLYWLGICMRGLGKVNRAEKCLWRCLAIEATKSTQQDLNMAATLHELGVCVRRNGRLVEAAELFKRCLGIVEAKLDVHNAQVTDASRNLQSKGARLQVQLEQAKSLSARYFMIDDVELNHTSKVTDTVLEGLGKSLLKAVRLL